VPIPHFPDRLHAAVWRNWSLVPIERLARVVGATPEAIRAIGAAMGLSGPPPISADQQRRSYLTVIRRNWHLLPYDQLLDLLEWTPEQLAYALREDDFLFIKLGSLKPDVPRLEYHPPDESSRRREAEIAEITASLLSGSGPASKAEPLFAFVDALSRPPASPVRDSSLITHHSSLRFGYSYFALYGDPLLETEADPYPDGLLARLSTAGVNGVWLQGVLYKLALFPWDASLSARYEERLQNLRALVARAAEHGIGIYLYLNEPRAMPLSFYDARPDLRGVIAGDHGTLCTSHPDVREYLSEAVAAVCRAVPDLAGIFTITASENLTSCWSHGRGEACPRCGSRAPAEVIAEVNAAIAGGIRRAGSETRFIAWDWGWRDEWAEAIIERLPPESWLMSVSEWSLPIERGGVASEVGEYSISAVGPGPRAQRHWEWARRRGLKRIAKIQAGNTWELSAVPYIPAVANVARQAANLQACSVDGLMLGWTLGGYPSPNLEVVAEVMRPTTNDQRPTTDGPGARSQEPGAALLSVARRRFGDGAAPAVVEAWQAFSAAFSQFPYHGGVVYQAPLQLGPANLLWEEPTGYRATMVGFPYDDLDAWRSIYPPEVFAAQLDAVADGFERGIEGLERALNTAPTTNPGALDRNAIDSEIAVARVVAIHYRSVANQVRFVLARRALAAATSAEDAGPQLDTLEQLLLAEHGLAGELYAIQSGDSRIGFEASNQYYYVPLDLIEKMLNCRDLLTRWLPAQRARLGIDGV
jgi:hypothetical protein